MPLRRGKAEPVVDTYSLVAVANLAPVMFRVSDSRVIHAPINKGNGGLGADELSMCGLSTLSRSGPTGADPLGGSMRACLRIWVGFGTKVLALFVLPPLVSSL